MDERPGPPPAEAIQRLLAGGRPARRLRSRDRDATLRLPASIPWPNWSGGQGGGHRHRRPAAAPATADDHRRELPAGAYRVAKHLASRSTRRPSALTTSWGVSPRSVRRLGSAPRFNGSLTISTYPSAAPKRYRRRLGGSVLLGVPIHQLLSFGHQVYLPMWWMLRSRKCAALFVQNAG